MRLQASLQYHFNVDGLHVIPDSLTGFSYNKADSGMSNLIAACDALVGITCHQEAGKERRHNLHRLFI